MVDGGNGYNPSDPPQLKVGNCGTPIREAVLQPVISNGVDIIWVIDGSGSMNDDYLNVLQGITDMMQNLPMINWRLVIISMTPHEAVAVESFPLIPGDTEEHAHAMFAQNVQGQYEYGFDCPPWAFPEQSVSHLVGVGPGIPILRFPVPAS